MQILNAIELIHRNIPYLGYRPITSILRTYFFANIGEHTVRKYMRHFGIKAVKYLKRKFKYRLNPKDSIFKNLIKDICVTSINQVWTSDITYKKTNEGMRYVCIIRDYYSGGVIGWKLSKVFTYEMLNELIEGLIIKNNITPNKLIFHSDHGAQYTSKKFIKLLETYGVIQSMSAKGKPSENQRSEQVFSHFKRDLVNPKKLDSDKEFERKTKVWFAAKNYLAWSIYQKPKMEYITQEKFVLTQTLEQKKLQEIR